MSLHGLLLKLRSDICFTDFSVLIPESSVVAQFMISGWWWQHSNNSNNNNSSCSDRFLMSRILGWAGYWPIGGGSLTNHWPLWNCEAHISQSEASMTVDWPLRGWGLDCGAAHCLSRARSRLPGYLCDYYWAILGIYTTNTGLILTKIIFMF